MELLRNSNPNGLGKYAVINLQTNQVEYPLCKIPD